MSAGNHFLLHTYVSLNVHILFLVLVLVGIVVFVLCMRRSAFPAGNVCILNWSQYGSSL